MNSAIILWSKPTCVQCDAVKRRIVDKLAGVQGSMQVIREEWAKLQENGTVVEHDLTDPDNEKTLEYFKGLGFTSAPVTEYLGSIAGGYVPAHVDDIIASWRKDHAHV